MLYTYKQREITLRDFQFQLIFQIFDNWYPLQLNLTSVHCALRRVRQMHSGIKQIVTMIRQAYVAKRNNTVHRDAF